MTLKRWTYALLAVLALPAGAAPQLIPSLKLLAEERYDTDLIFRNETGGAGQFMSRLTPEIGGQLKDHNFEGGAWYAGDFRLRHGSGTFTWEHRAGLNIVTQPWERFTFRTELRFWRVVDPTSLPRLGLARTFGPIVYGKALISGDVALTPRVLLRPGYLFEAAHVLDGVQLPGFVHAPYLGLWYGFNPRVRGGLEYRFQYFLLGSDGSMSHGTVAAVEWRATRHMTITTRAGPAWYVNPGNPSANGLVPRVSLDLWHELRSFNWGVTAGHDLVGASGFTAALWADYLSAQVGYRVAKPVRLFAIANLFRNGKAPDEGFSFKLFTPTAGVSTGYAVEGGVEWEVARNWMLQGTVSRIVQTGGGTDVASAVTLTRNIALVRLMVTAL